MGKLISGVLSFAAMASLAACGGGAATGGIFNPTPAYETLTDTSGGTSTLAGALVNTATLATDPASGNYTHASQSIFVSDPTAAGQTAVATAGTLPFNTYDYAQSADVTVGATTYTGIIGLATSAADVAASTNATYSLEFEGSYSTNTTNETMTDWSGNLSANFSSNEVDLQITGSGVATFNEIRVDGATISGGNFSGGSLTTRQSGAVVNVTGTAGDTQGSFFGYDSAISAPDEVGGVLASNLGSNILSGAFIGD